MKPKRSSKIEKSVLLTVLDLEISKGHLKWRVSDLARLSKVSRPLVYYHFGRTKIEILDSCVDLVARDYYGLDESQAASLTQGAIAESLMRTRNLFLKSPSLVLFYQKWRSKSSALQRKLITIEKQYQTKIKSAFPFMTGAQVMTLHAFFHGAITAPFLTPDGFAEACASIESWIEATRISSLA